MSDSRDQLKRAYKLIKRDRTAEAQAIIRPILAAEPDNAQAWWLLAHTVDDPVEVRAALNKMLELDPRNSNAPKARELLTMLEQQYPAPTGFEEEEIAPVFATAETQVGDVFGGEDFEALNEEMFPSLEEPAAEKREAPGVAFDVPQTRSDMDFEGMFQPEGKDLDDESKARLEEKAGRRGRGRLLRAAILILLIPLAIVALLVVLTSGGGTTKKDPGALTEVQVQSDKVSQALAAAQSDLITAKLGGEPRTLVAHGALGNTLFVEFCSQPTLEMSDLISQGMAIAVRQAPAVKDDLAAVGVAVNLCSSPVHDTLYRTSAPVNEAVRYLNGEFGQGDNGLASFQATWKKS